jgi:hypothetical protein
VTLSVTDVHGNIGAGTATVTVIDNIAPEVSAPAPVAACDGASPSNNYILTASRSDNCSFGYSYAITGATTGSGAGSFVNRNFNVGTSTVTWTVTDASGNTDQASTTVTIYPLPSVSIANQASICGQNTIFIGYGLDSLALSASSSGGATPYSYRWTPPSSNTFGPNASYVVRPTATTTYAVTVKDAHECTASASLQVKVKDVRCGNKNDKVMVCHDGNNAICISPNAVPAHLSQHGDCLGDCGDASARKTGPANPIDLEGGRIAVFPNPAHGTIQVELKDIGSPYRAYQVSDINGRIVSSRQLAGDVLADLISVDISHLVPGIYIIRAVTDDGVSTTKFRVE